MAIQPLKPVESQNPVFLRGEDLDLANELICIHGGKTLAELKEDGYRIHVHKKNDTLKAFTRQMKEVYLPLFPELESSLSNLPNCIIDCELAGMGIGKESFDAVKRRFRSRFNPKNLQEYLESGIVEQFPMQLRVFDTLYWENGQTINEPLTERRKLTESILEKRIIPSSQEIITDPDSLHELFTRLVEENYEGLVCKRPDSFYVPGSRTEDWVKLKRTETFDLAVIGAKYSDGRLHQILVGPYNAVTGRYEAIATVNAQRENMDELLETRLTILDSPAENVDYGKNHPERFVLPNTLVEVGAMNIQRGKNGYACGLDNGQSHSLRIGWLKSIRDDKPLSDITTTQQIEKQYGVTQ